MPERYRQNQLPRLAAAITLVISIFDHKRNTSPSAPSFLPALSQGGRGVAYFGTDVYMCASRWAFNRDVASQPTPPYFTDGHGGRRRPSGSRKNRDHTLLWAQASVLVLLTSFVAVDTPRHSDANRAVPMPRYDLLIGQGALLQACTAPLSRLSEVFRQFRFGQTAWHQQPPVISDHNHLSPSMVQETSYPFGNSSKLGGSVIGQPSIHECGHTRRCCPIHTRPAQQRPQIPLRLRTSKPLPATAFRKS